MQPSEEPLDGTIAKSIVQLGFVLSKFEYGVGETESNIILNPRVKEGRFRLEIADVSVYSEPTPAIVLLSSAGIEKRAMCDADLNATGDSDASNQLPYQIPIVQLNPGNSNHRIAILSLLDLYCLKLSISSIETASTIRRSSFVEVCW